MKNIYTVEYAEFQSATPDEFRFYLFSSGVNTKKTSVPIIKYRRPDNFQLIYLPRGSLHGVFFRL